MPKYLLLIVEDESAFESGGQATFDDVMAAHMAFTEEVSQLGGTIVGGEALQPVATATFLRGTRTDGGHDGRQPVARPQGDPRRLLPHRGQGRRARPAASASAARRQYGYIEVRPIWDFAAG